MSENQDELKAQIKVWLKQQKMTREEFAAECFVSPNTVRNWLARVSIPKDKEALIRLMMEKTEREKELKEAARAHWKPFAVMVNTDDYKLIEKAARKDNMTVEEWAEGILIRDAQERMEHVYPESLRVAEEPKGLPAGLRRSGSSIAYKILPGLLACRLFSLLLPFRQ